MVIAYRIRFFCRDGSESKNFSSILSKMVELTQVDLLIYVAVGCWFLAIGSGLSDLDGYGNTVL